MGRLIRSFTGSLGHRACSSGFFSLTHVLRVKIVGPNLQVRTTTMMTSDKDVHDNDNDGIDGNDQGIADEHDELTDTMESRIISVAAHDPEQWPGRILRGSEAQLAPLRHTETHTTFFVGPRTLLLDQNGIPCRIQWQDGDSSMGDIYITESQVLFVASTETKAETAAATATATSTELDDQDWAIGATCIHLHAMTDEPEESIYLQLAEDGGDDNDGNSTLEVTLIPIDPSNCQILFDGLCKLVARHPLQLDDDDNDGPGGFFMGGGDNGNDDGDEMIWAPSAGFGSLIPYDDDDDNDDDEGGATDEERAAMLARLDNMLIVQPEFEVHDGQFDDAEEGHDDDDDDDQHV